jgi:hypothetical protein
MQDFGEERSGGRETTWKVMRRWEDNIKWMLNKNDGWAWIGFIWLDRVKRRNFVHMVMNFRLPQMSESFSVAGK